MNRISVDFGKQIGAIRPLHGVNSGPRTYSFYHNTTQYFQEAGIPYLYQSAYDLTFSFLIQLLKE